MSHVELKRIGTERNQTKTEIATERERIRNIDNRFQITQNPEELESLKNERRQIEERLEELDRRLEDLHSRHQKLQEKHGVLVSEHAMLRYFERVMGFDLDEIRNRIIPEKTKEQISVLRSGVFPVGEFRVRAKSGTVVTVVGKKRKKRPA
jgi:predicted  nucleic acid-binding Zn-ribbon protein